MSALWCPNIPSLFKKEVKAAKGFPGYDVDSYSTPSNSGWPGNHPNLFWTQQAPASDPYSYSLDFENKVLQTLERLEFLNSHTKSINELDTQMSHLGDVINTSEEEFFLS